MMDMLDFSEEEIQGQLAILGYTNIPQHRLQEFKRDLDELIQHGKWGSPTSPPRQETTLKPSPPAYTKERVSGCCVCGDPERRAVLTACPDRDPSWKQGRCDSYAQHSVAPKLQLPPGVPTRIQVELEPASSPASTPDTQGRHVIKRKVLRKQNGLSLVCEESVYSDDSASHLDLLPVPAQHDSDLEDEDGSSRSSSSEADGGSSSLESYIRGLFEQTRSDGDLRPKPKSFIRPVMSQPTVKRSDPVAKYFEYKQLWEMFKAPGERDRRALRREIKDRLAHQPPPPKPRRVLAPNTYIVPTEKKRSALRWEIRNDLANGLIPHKFTY
ncbi:centriolar and ciliogenesis-associated protein HYLS1 isoform 1-T2 [Aulostomus maculatus]